MVKETFGLLQPTRIVHVGRSHKRLCRAGNLLKEGRLLACVSNSNSTCGFPHGAVAVPEAANRKVRFTPVACLDGAHTEKCSLWKSFQGPGNDWPLALCDGNTIHGEDSIAADVVFPNRFTENLRFYHNPSHKWFYVKDLAEDEVIVLRQTDSDMEGGGGKQPRVRHSTRVGRWLTWTRRRTHELLQFARSERCSATSKH